MKYRQLVKTVNTRNYYNKIINPVKAKAQYNPERFHLWVSLYLGPKGEEFNMLYSPHLRFLNDRNDDSYYKLQKLYGRNHKWIKAKTHKFLSVLNSIEQNGFTEEVEIVEKPLVKNKFNKGFEIFEGHHRIACALYLGIKEVPCRIIRSK
ncbi:MAG: ParB/RepB/Spo0J family partition protein [Candidatus Thorarchaeota archaeon]